MKASSLLFGLAPWILFSLIAERAGTGAVGWAALAACLGSLLLAVRGAVRDGLKVIDAAGVLTFGALTVLGLTGGRHVEQSLVDYGRGGAALLLAAIMLVSAFTVPFTEQYARAGVDRRYWGSPVFRAVNRRISLLWAGVDLRDGSVPPARRCPRYRELAAQLGGARPAGARRPQAHRGDGGRGPHRRRRGPSALRARPLPSGMTGGVSMIMPASGRQRVVKACVMTMAATVAPAPQMGAPAAARVTWRAAAGVRPPDADTDRRGPGAPADRDGPRRRRHGRAGAGAAALPGGTTPKAALSDLV
ncbi:hypothetical protein GA0115256_134813, partial [Streptomyces sp. DconLS]